MAFPATYNFSYYRGDTFEFNITPRDASGNLFSLTGYTSIFTVANQRGDGNEQVVCYSTTDTANNVIRCAIRAADSEDIDFPSESSAVYDVQITNSAATPYPKIYTILTGDISIREQVTGAVEESS